MGTREEARRYSILLHEERTGPGILFSLTARRLGEQWQISGYGAKIVPEVSQVKADLAVCNDSSAEGLILQVLGETFGESMDIHMFQIFVRCCAEKGMHLRQRAEVID